MKADSKSETYKVHRNEKWTVGDTTKGGQRRKTKVWTNLVTFEETKKRLWAKLLKYADAKIRVAGDTNKVL